MFYWHNNFCISKSEIPTNKEIHKLTKKMTNHFEQKFTSKLSYLTEVRKFVNETFRSFNHTRLNIEVDLIVLAVNEAFTNIVKYAYQNQSDKMVAIRLSFENSTSVIELADQGLIFDPATVKDADLSGTKDHGYGVCIIRKIVDKMTYKEKSSESGWNLLKLTKKI